MISSVFFGLNVKTVNAVVFRFVLKKVFSEFKIKVLGEFLKYCFLKIYIY